MSRTRLVALVAALLSIVLVGGTGTPATALPAWRDTGTSWTRTNSFASTAWCNPSLHRRPGRMRPVNSSMMFTLPSCVTM